MSELEEVSFWPGKGSYGSWGNGSADGSYSRVGAAMAPMVSCRRRTVLILVAVLALIFIISVSIPSGMLQHYKNKEAASTSASSGDRQPEVSSTTSPDVTDTPPTSVNRSTANPSDTSTSTTTPTPIPTPSFRLPKSVKPIQYDLGIDLGLTGETKDKNADIPYNGTVEILLNIVNATDLIILHAVNMTITSVKVKTEGNAYTEVEHYELEPDVGQLKINVSTPYVAGVNVTLKLVFNNTLNDEKALQGFYKSSYKSSNDKETIIATTQFESVFAREAFPCFDEPSFKAKFRLNITRPKGWVSLFNTPLIRTELVDEKTEKAIYGYTPTMSSYLVAFIVCDFGNTTTNITNKDNNTITITVHGQKEQVERGLLDFAKDTTGKLLLVYEDFFNISYPLDKLDIVAIPSFAAGAMENWGLITFRETALLYDNTTSSNAQRQYVASIIAHELAHQWFGNLVTMNWWNELWLNEGFATYVGELIGSQNLTLEGENWPVLGDFKNGVTRALDLDALRGSHALSQSEESVNTLGKIEAMFDSISYQKGSAIINMLDTYVTRNVTKAALQDYLNEHSYGNAKASDLWSAFDKAYKDVETNASLEAISTMMVSWTESVGYPVIAAEVEADKIALKQSRFYLCDTCGEKDNTTWQIPVRYPPSKQIMLDKDTGNIPKGGWMKLNLGWNGYYLVKYSDYSKINLTGLEDIDVANLMYDTFELFRAGQVEPADFVTLLNEVAISESPGYLSLKMALKAAGYLLDIYSLKYDQYKNISTTVYSRLKVEKMNVTFDAVKNMTIENRNLLSLKLAMALSIDHVKVTEDIPKMNDLKDRWINSLKDDSVTTTGEIHNDISEQIWKCAFLSDEEGLWNSLWNLYINSPVPSEQSASRRVLASGTSVPLLVRLLESSNTKADDRISIITEVASTRSGRLIAWDYIRTNIEDLKESKLLGFAASRLIQYSTDHFADENRLKEMHELFDEGIGAGVSAAKQAFERVQANINLVRDKSEALLKAFADLKS